MSLRWNVFPTALVVLIPLTGCGPHEPRNVGPPIPHALPAEPFTHPTGLRFVVLPAGQVQTPRYDLELRRPILISAHEVTNAQYEKFAPGHPRSKSAPGDNHPVSNITAKEAAAFCDWLTKTDPLGRRCKLPSAAEWEYAARGAESNRLYPWGDEIGPARACYKAEGAKPVGSFAPNRFGLYDAAGNAAEWVETDDVPPYELRGGAWCDGPEALQLTAVGTLPAEKEELNHHGLRVVCEPPLFK